jgi:hypothetical protein
MTKIFSVLVVAGLLALVMAASAMPNPSVGQSIVQTGDGDTAYQLNSEHTDVAIKHASYKAFDYGTYSNVYNYYVTQQSSGVLGLDVGVVEFDRVLIANQVLRMKIIQSPNGNATAYYIMSATPIGIFTTDNQTDSVAVHAIESKLEYDMVYDVMNHGTVLPVDLVPYFTTKNSIIPSKDAAYLVIDNRYYPQDAILQVLAVDSGIPQDRVEPLTTMFRKTITPSVPRPVTTPDMFRTDLSGHAVTT